MADKYLFNYIGTLTEREATVTSAGSDDGGKIPALDSNGKLDNSMMPTGIAAESVTATAVGDIANGDFVNLYNDSGLKARKADASNSRRAHGFALVGVSNGETVTVYFGGQTNTAISSPTLTIGATYYLSAANAGLAVAVANIPTTAGHLVQTLGIALSSTSLHFVAGNVIVLA